MTILSKKRISYPEKGHNWWRIMGIGVWHWSQSWIIPMEAYRRAKTEKKHLKCGQMWRFCSLFFSIAMAWCIMNYCHKVVRSIRNTTLKLYVGCVKQCVRNAQNCGKMNQWILPHNNAPAYISMLVHKFLAKNKSVIMPRVCKQAKL